MSTLLPASFLLSQQNLSNIYSKDFVGLKTMWIIWYIAHLAMNGASVWNCNRGICQEEQTLLIGRLSFK